jgi:hypothetical protein
MLNASVGREYFRPKTDSAKELESPLSFQKVSQTFEKLAKNPKSPLTF